MWFRFRCRFTAVYVCFSEAYSLQSVHCPLTRTVSEERAPDFVLLKKKIADRTFIQTIKDTNQMIMQVFHALGQQGTNKRSASFGGSDGAGLPRPHRCMSGASCHPYRVFLSNWQEIAQKCSAGDRVFGLECVPPEKASKKRPASWLLSFYSFSRCTGRSPGSSHPHD